ncbi:MAG: SPW repeat protein [Rhizobiales bacterium]|nr:SPW repeat protein [Hyphomicrobiales bacterium]
MQLQLTTHRPWEDWLVTILGILVLAAPITVFREASGPALFNGLAVGVVILAMVLFEAMNRLRLEEIVQFAAGVWLMISVFVIDYGLAGQLRIWHFILGALVAILAAFEFWQDSVKRA